MKTILLTITICLFIAGCCSTSSTTTTETTTVKAIVPEIHGTVIPIETLVPIRSLPESTQLTLTRRGFEWEDTVEIIEAETQTETGSVKATVYRGKKRGVAVLEAKPKSPIDATQTKSVKKEVVKPWYQIFVEFKWILLILLGLAVVFLILKFTGKV